MARSSATFVCQGCGTVHAKWSGKCDACGAWNSIIEEGAAAPIGNGPPQQGEEGAALISSRARRAQQEAAGLFYSGDISPVVLREFVRRRPMSAGQRRIHLSASAQAVIVILRLVLIDLPLRPRGARAKHRQPGVIGKCRTGPFQASVSTPKQSNKGVMP